MANARLQKGVWGLVGLMALLVSGCATTRLPSAIQNAEPDVAFQQLVKDPKAFRGKTVVLGGSIIETINRSQKTVLIILQQDLDAEDRPIGNDQSRGRFMVWVPGFLDPAIYAQGRQITVLGAVIGEEVRPLNDIAYTYPLIEKKELYLWPVEDQRDAGPNVYFGFGFGTYSF